MKLKRFTTISYKNKTYIISLFLICGVLLNSYAGFSYSNIRTFFLNPIATISSSSEEICRYETTIITFEGSDGTEPYTFTYNINNGTPIEITTTSGSSVDITLEGTSAGDFTYNLTNVKDGNENSQVITDQKVIVKVNPLPTVDFSFTNNNTCSGESLQFTSNATGNGTLSYSWNFGDGTTSTEENPTNVYNVVGNGSQVFSVSLIVSDDNGCNTTIIKDVQVHKIPDISFFSGSGGFSNCSDGTSDNFNLELFNSSVSSSEITSYTIDWGNGIETFSGFPTNGSGIMHAYPIGVFTLSITATNVNGCSNLITYDISNGSNPGGAFESPGSTVGLCLPMDDPLGFYLTILDWGSNPINTSYSVNFGDGNVQNFTQQYLESEEEYNSSNPAASIGYKVYHSYTQGSCLESTGEFIATLTITNDCGDTKFTVDSINVLEPSEALFDVSSNIECINTPIEFENQTLIGDGVNCNKTARFTWDFGDGTFINTPFGSTADNQTHTYTAMGNYTVILSVTGDCGTDTYQEDICIEPEMIASYDLDTQEGCIPLAVNTQNTIDESELCSDPDYKWTVSYTDANCGSVEDWEFTDGTAASSENPQFLFNNPGAYTLTQNIITNCGTFSTQKIINVKKPPTAAINPIANLCQPAVLTPVAVVENCTDDLGVTYSWTFSGGTPTTSTLQNPENISYDTTGTFTVTLEVTNECGVSNTAIQQFEVLEKPIITNSPTTQEICSNQSTTPISLTASNTNSSFLWTATTVPNNPNITGFTSSGTSQVIPSQTIVNNGTTSGNVVYTVTPDLNGCLGDPVEVLTVIVNPTPIITTQPVGSEVCLNGNATLLEVDYAYGTGAPAYQWFSNTNNINSGGTLITGATNTSYNPSTNTVGEIFYYAEISFSSGACSQIVSNTTSVNIVPQITINAFAPQQTICVGGTADQLEITFSGGTGNPTYQWFSNTSNTNTGGTLIATATNNSYTPPVFTNAGNFYFYVEISLDGNGCSSALSDVLEVNVLADPIINTQPITSQELCQNAVPTDLAVVVSGGTTSNKIYQWYLNTTNSNAGGIPITGETLGNYSPSTNTEGAFYYYAVITQPESGCAVISNVSILRINAAPTFTTQPTPSDICLNGNATLLEVDYANGTVAPAYQWFSNTNNINSGGTPITGATNTSYNPSTNTVGETFYYAEISFSSGACSQIVSNTASVNVVPQITINAFAPQQTICVGGTADQLEITFSGGTGNPTYQWFSNTSNTNTGGTLIVTATDSAYTPPVFTNAGNFYFYAEISLDGDGCSFALSDVFEVNVLADPIINTQPITSQELCQNAVPTDLAVVVSGGTTSNKIYQWYLNTTNSNAGGITITGETLGTYSPSTDTVGTFYYYAVITQPESGCAVTSDVSVLKINVAPTFTTQPTPSEICLNGTANTLEVLTENGVGTPTYQWFSNTTNSSAGATEITGATNSTYNPPTNTVGEVFYFVVISFDGGCSDIQSTITLVNTIAEPIATAVDPEQTICLNGQADTFEITLTGGVGNPTYQWFSNTTNTNSGGTAIAGATNSTYNTGVLSSISAFYYYLEVTLDGTGCDLAKSDVFTVNVVADPVIDTQAIASQEVCQNTILEALEVVVSGNTNTGDFSYQWFSNSTNANTGGTLITGATNNVYNPDNSTVGTFFYYVVINQATSGCEVTSEVSTIIINEGPAITTQPVGSDICLDGVANVLEVLTENGVGTPTYQWLSNTTNSSTGATKITGATNSTYNPPTNTVREVFYFVVISFDGGCSDIQSTIALVNTISEPIATAVDPEQTICLNGQADTFEITLTGGVGNPTYQWFSNTTNTNSGGTAIAGATNSTYNTGVLSSISAFYYYLEVTLDGTGCDLAKSDVFTVNVVADPVIDTQAIASQEVCQNTILEALEVVVSGNTNTGDFSYQWFSNATNANTGGTLITGTTTNVYNPDNSTVGTFFYYVVINQATSGCEVTSEVSTIIINEGPAITTQPIGSDICLDGVANVLEVLTENGVGTPTYQWFSNTTNSSAGATEITGATNSTYNPPTNTVREVFYFVVISFDGGCSDIQSTIALVNVNQIPVIYFAQITIYSEETFLLAPSLVASNIVPTGTTYTWTAPTSSTPGAILGSSAEISPQTNISQTLENTDMFPVIETYIITPATPNCTGNPFTLEVTVNPKIISNVLVTNNTCFESNDGIITTNITGGVPFTSGTPYLISWTGPNSFTSTASSISNLIAGIYTLRIEDRNGVSITEQYTVTQTDLLTITTDIEKNISCFQGNDGAIEVTISGGTLSYTFNWTTTDGTGIVQGNKDQSGLTTGTYNLELMDKNACLTTKTFILTEPKAIGISTVLKEDILCFGDAAGAIGIAVTGGTPIEVSSGVFEYTYSWSGPNGFTSNVQNISNLFAGTYTIEITDDLGCIERTDIVLTEPIAIEINYTKIDVTCYGATDGAIDVTVTGGRPPYQISWSNFGNGYSQSNLSAGNYIVTITDENQCEANVTITIEQPIFFIAPVVSSVSCNNANDASIDLNLTGGVAPIRVSWSDDPSAGVQRNNLAPGTFVVTVIDSDINQCPLIQTFIITNPPAIAVTSVVTDAIDCTIENSGSILLEVSGGTPPYDFMWNTGQTTEDLTNIPLGDYSVEVKDKNNCIINKQFSIYRQEPIEIEFLVTEIPDCDLKTVSQRTVAKVTGGFLPYTCSWSAGSVSMTDNTIMNTSQNSSYTLTITDGKGCTESKNFLVDLPSIGNADYSYDAFSIDNYNLLSIADPIQFTNLTIGNYSNITWDFGDGSPTTSDENPVHIYDQVGVFNVVLKIELDFGCIAIIEKTLKITQGYVLINPNAFSPNNDGYNETIRPSFKGFKEIEMTIYDTWGVPIYYENNLELNGWDGRIKGLAAENGNYVMVVKGSTFYEKEIITITALTLLK